MWYVMTISYREIYSAQPPIQTFNSIDEMPPYVTALLEMHLTFI